MTDARAWIAGMLLVATLTAGPPGAIAQASLPAPTGAVSDFANLLADGDEARLTRVVADVEQATTAEIAVATVPSLDGLTVEEYATKLFAAWGVGQAGKDNGVLILVAPSEREMRIEVGYGLEGVLPDGLAGQIIRETFLPAFRADDYPRGIVEGTERVAAIVKRNEPLTEEQLQALASAGSGSSNDALLPFVLIPFFGIFVAIGSGFAGAGLRTRAGFPILFGLFFAGVPMLMSLLVNLPIAIWILLGLAVVFLVIGWKMGGRPGARGSMRGTHGSSKSGWVWGGDGSSGGSSGSGSSGSSGGFGGGRSGGGGASGRW
ncbi:MAG: YgcG family protein [Vicinamibacterales bacterium]